MGKVEICNGKSEKDMAGCGFCYTSTEECIHSRRCFMTGEYCSKQTNIQRERKRLYENKKNEGNKKNGNDEIDAPAINAFVIMNFSDMSDVVYKWRIRTFIELLTKYLYLDDENGRLYCCAQEKKEAPQGMRRVSKINVIRADSDPASNYVVCSRICQQMQIADLVIVDVTNQNANIFYEFGMAVAFGKLILPICYSESFYRMEIPKKLKKLGDIDEKNFEKHIGCYPWRKRLFEYYGILYRSGKSDLGEELDATEGKKGVVTEYFELEDVGDEKYGFSDHKYTRFPYHEKQGASTVGEIVYERLKKQYNDSKKKDNTLVVYTADGFLNSEQAGQCIVNFYHNITARMNQEQCFCGERVGVLVQDSKIPQEEKDAGKELNLFYSVGDIIHIGVNQATYLAGEERIKTSDGLIEPKSLMDEEKGLSDKEKIRDDQKENIRRFVKGHIRNRGLLVYPQYPVYVNRLKNKMQEGLLETSETKMGEMCSCSRKEAFCLYHVMLRTLRYTNEIVVDITDNCLESLFWLGMAHGANVHAITVLHEKTAAERKIIDGTVEKRTRNVFDVAGLWSAIFHTKDTEGFYQQLAMAQLGIERHSKLMAVGREFYEKSIREYIGSFDSDPDKKKPEELRRDKKEKERKMLESYYRNRFWNTMLRYNRLRIYLSQKNDVDGSTKEPVVNTAKWDFDAVSALSYYLSKRTVIGEYLVKALKDSEGDPKAEKVNFISVGTFSKPLGKTLPEYINGMVSGGIHSRKEISEIECLNQRKKAVYKGFENSEGDSLIYTQHPLAECAQCSYRSDGMDEKDEIICEKEKIRDKKCFLKKNGLYEQVAQLILWRENPKTHQERSYFRVALNGSSGPSTHGIAALFIDQEQKKEHFENQQLEEGEYLLCELQEKVREAFMKEFLGRLGSWLQGMEMTSKEAKRKLEDNQKARYCSLVKHAVSYYLSTILYRYFLPFVSESDINRITNGLHMFMCSMRASNESPFDLNYPEKGDADYPSSVSEETVNKVIDETPAILLSVLKGFRGLEAFYQVKVKYGDEGEPIRDTRKPQEIKMLKSKVPEVKCFFEG